MSPIQFHPDFPRLLAAYGGGTAAFSCFPAFLIHMKRFCRRAAERRAKDESGKQENRNGGGMSPIQFHPNFPRLLAAYGGGTAAFSCFPAFLIQPKEVPRGWEPDGATEAQRDVIRKDEENGGSAEGPSSSSFIPHPSSLH